jgi:hypothetical protein
MRARKVLKRVFPLLFRREALEEMVLSLKEELSSHKEDFDSHKAESKSKMNSANDDMWNYKREVDSGLSELVGQMGWRKTKRKLDNWKNEHEYVEFFAVVYVLDNGYRKVLAPYLKTDSNGNSEVDKKDWVANEWDGSLKMRCYMVSRFVLPGYYKLEDFLTNDSKNFTFEKMFGKTYQELLSYMSEHNYSRNSGDMYSVDFYEL